MTARGGGGAADGAEASAFVREDQHVISRQRAAEDVAVQIVGKGVLIAISVVVTAVLVRALGEDRYGEWATLLAIAQIVGNLGQLGLQQTTVRQITLNRADEAHYLGAALSIEGALAIPLGGLCAVITTLVATNATMKTTGLLLSATLVGTAIQIVGLVFQARVRNDLTVIVTTFNTLLWSGAVIVIAQHGSSMVAFAWAYLGVYTLTGLVQTGLARRLVRFRFSRLRELAPPLIRSGLPLGVSVLLALTYARIDQVLVFRLAGDQAASLYGAVYRILDQLQFVPLSIMTTIFPLLVTALTDHRRLKRLVRQTTELMYLVAVPALVFGVVAARPMVTLLFGSSFSAAAPALSLLMGTFVVLSLNLLYAQLLVARSEQSAFLRFTVVGLVVNVLLNVTLVPAYGFIAAAAVTVITQAIVLLLCIRKTPRDIRALPTPRVLVGCPAAALLMAAAVGGARAIGAPAVSLLAVGPAAYVIGIASLRVFRLADLRELRAGRRTAGSPGGSAELREAHHSTARDEASPAWNSARELSPDPRSKVHVPRAFASKRGVLSIPGSRRCSSRLRRSVAARPGLRGPRRGSARPSVVTGVRSGRAAVPLVAGGGFCVIAATFAVRESDAAITLLVWLLAAGIALVAHVLLRGRTVVGLVLTYGFLGFGAAAAAFYHPTAADFYGSAPQIAAFAAATPGRDYLLLFGGIALILCVTFRISSEGPRGSDGKDLSAFGVSIERMSPLPTATILLAVLPLALDAYGVGFHTIFYSPQYLAHTGPLAASKVGRALGPVGILIAGSLLFSARPLPARVAAGAVVFGYGAVYLGTATRSLGLIIPLLYLGGLLSGRWSARQRRVGLVFVLLIALIMVQLPLSLRGLPRQGLAPAITYIRQDPRLLIQDPIANLLFGAPLTLYVARDVPRLPLHDLWTSISPLPSGYTDWNTVREFLRVNDFMPYSAFGELINYGAAWFIAAVVLSGLLFSYLERLVRRSHVPGLGLLMLNAVAVLLVVQSTEYNLRSAARLCYYLAVVVIAFVAGSTLLNRRPS